MTLRIAPISGPALEVALPHIAQLRVEIFRAFPYLYDGDVAYEAQYLRPYVDSPDAVVIGAWDGDRLVGAATGTPMEDHAGAFGAPFTARGYDLSTIFYCAESVLLPAYRGRGIGHAFFDEREAKARALGRTHIAFCAVIRPEDHPAQPGDYRPLDPFWRRRGYSPVEGLITSFGWIDIGNDTETNKQMQFWMRDL
ncbi:MAG: GNAT family N-acetyltransferase [Pseudomonadota bacterium]